MRSQKVKTMLILLKRIAKKPAYTIGRIFIEGEYFCDTIEDTDRNLHASMDLEELKSRKVAGQTAIPRGCYQITYTESPKFKSREWAKPLNGQLPLLVNVPGFTGIRIHPGRDQDSTAGCLIVGENKVVGKVINSQATYHKLNDILYPAFKAGEKIWIQIA